MAGYANWYGNCKWWGMATRSFLSLGAACVLSVGFAQKSPAPSPKDEVFPLRTVSHNAFQPGEKLTYVLHYGWLNAGEATLELKEGDREIEGRKVLHAVGKGQSTGAFKAFYKVDDRYETFFDEEGVFPWVFTRRVDEGGYTFSQDYLYLQHRRKVTTQENKTYDVPASAQDMLSAFYFARTIDYSTATPGQEFTIPCFMDNEEWNLRMRYIGKETIKLRNGKFRCLKFQPVVQEGRVFKANDDLNVWITDDANHIPVLAEAKVLVGSIKMELSSYEGLANPVAKL
ncbi:MAG: DUF3108 domain-containing protein [Flavobacteriales bacterium]|jgi:hypothetical protein|nr:DUF3108 domain-containing protein [Flavobacteriales bacterium]MCI1751630.1 DUF3108 domain-containing protein [Flavobacteriales bacterium]